MLNEISGHSFGGGNKSDASLLGRMYRAVIDMAKPSSSGVTKRPGYVPTPGAVAANAGDFSHPSARSSTSDETEVGPIQASLAEQLSCALTCDINRVERIVRRYPGLLDMDVEELALRVVEIKQVVHMCDVSLLVERAPRAFFEAEDVAQLTVDLDRRVRLLCENLPGANLTIMLHEDPMLLFDPIESGLEGMWQLWPSMDEDTLRNSCPIELCLAIRACSDLGPPNRV